MKKLIAGFVVGLVLASAASISAQGSLSNQVLRLLSRANTWTGVQTYDPTVGLVIGTNGTTPTAGTTNTLYNMGGSLYWNGDLLTTASGAGTVTSVAMTVPSILSVSGSPINTSGTLAVTLASQSQNLVFASPNGSSGTPTFRALVAGDLPNISGSLITSGTVAVANGGTGLTSGTSGGVLAFTASGTIASSAALAANQLVVGGGAGVVPATVGSLGTATTLLHGNAAGLPTFAAVDLTADVSGLLPVANGGTGIASGTSGGVLAFTASGTLASSSALTANAIVLGGGAGAAPSALGSLGSTTTVLHGNASGAPTFAAVSLSADVSGTLPTGNGGTGLTSYTQGDILYASGASTVAKLAKDTNATRYLSNTGSSNNPAWAQINLANGVTGTLPAANGGTAVTSTPSNGQLLIGDGSGYTLATLTGTSNQITVTNGVGSITLATPQSIGTTSTPRFARLGLGTGAGATAVITTTGQFDIGYYDNGNSTATATLNWNNGMEQKITLTANCTFTINNPITGVRYTLVLIQDGTGSRTVTWPGTLLWKGGAAPTLTTGANKKDIIYLLWDGTNYLGTSDLNF